MTNTAQDVGPVVATVDVDAPRERVFELFTTPEHLVRWWPDAVSSSLASAGAWSSSSKVAARSRAR